MIEYLRGTCIHRTPTSLIIEVEGIGYEVAISLNTYNALTDGKECKVLIHEVLREDTHDLYGFSEESERQLFRLLITVSGVGPNTARVMLSSYPPSDLAAYISGGNADALQSVKGIGTKTAQRIIVDLKKKVPEVMGALEGTASSGATIASLDRREVFEEAVKAFATLGYPTAAGKKVVSAILKDEPDIALNDLIRKGLKMF